MKRESKPDYPAPVAEVHAIENSTVLCVSGGEAGSFEENEFEQL